MCQNLPQKLQEQKCISEGCQSSEEQPIFIPSQSRLLTWEKCSSAWRPKTHSNRECWPLLQCRVGVNSSVWAEESSASHVWPEFQPCRASSARRVLQISSLTGGALQAMCLGSHMEWTDPCGKASDCRPWKRSLNTFHASAVENASLQSRGWILGFVNWGPHDRY